MRKTKLALLVSLATCSISVLAQAKPDWTFTGNATLASDYRFRGISQTDKDPAFQGGFDVAHSSGFYAGNWNSNVDALFFSGANLEMDIYGGYKMSLGNLNLDFGVLHYYYPGSGKFPGTLKIDNTELYAGGTIGPFGLKYYHAVSDFFGFPDSKNSYYLDGSFNYDLGGGLGVNAHAGYQKLKGAAQVVEIGGGAAKSSIIDYKIGVTYDLSGWVFGAAYVATDRDIAGSSGRNVSNSTVVLSLLKAF